MKRIFLIFTVAVISVGLAGCDLITPEQVEQISEEYCRENPTSEICQGDTVGDLEDDVILNVFNTIIDEYNDETNDTFCDDYFSVTNPDLLDACRASREGLVPESFTDFSVVSVEKQATLSTQDVYEITLISEDLTIEVVFSIGLVNVEGIMYISSWSFETTDTSPADYDVSLEDARAFFEQFIADYLNQEIPSEELCNQYFTTEDAFGCIEERDDSLEINFSVVLNAMDVTDQPGIFDVELAFDDDETVDVDIEFTQISFVYDDEGNIVMTFIDDGEDPGTPENWLNADEAFDVIAEYLADYSDSEMSNDEFNDKYFEGMMDWDFFLNRNDDKAKGVTYSLIFVEEATEEPLDYLVVTLQRNYEGEAKTIVIRARVNDLGDGNYYLDILFEDESGLDFDMLYNYMLQFTEDYQDLDISDSDICQMYFPNEDPDNCAEMRQSTLEDGAILSVEEFNIVRDYYEVVFQFDKDGETTYQSVFVNFYYDEANILRFEFNDLGFDEIDYYDALAFMQNFVFQYSNYDLSSYDVCIQLFEGDSYDECVTRREMEMTEGIILTDFELFNDGYGYQIDFHYINLLGEITTKHLEAYFYYDVDGNLKLELFEDFGLIPYDVVYPYLEAMVLDYNDTSLDSNDFCNIYFDSKEIPGCIDHREQSLLDGTTVALLMLYPEYDHYRIEFEYSNPSGDVWYEDVNAFFYYNEDGFLNVEFRGDGPENFPYDEALNYFSTFLNDFSNPSMTDTEFCNLYFPGMDTFCLWDRTLMPLENMNISLVSFDFDGYSFVAEVAFENLLTGNTEYRNVYLDFYWDEYGNVAMHLNEDPLVDFLNYSDSVVILQQFLIDLTDPDVSNEQMAAWYFDYHMDPEFEIRRTDILTNNYALSISAVNDPSFADGQDFLEVIIDTFDDVDLVSTDTVWVRVMLLPSGYHYLEFKNGGNPGDKLDLSYDEAFAIIDQFMTDYANELLDSNTVCSAFFDSYDFPQCVEKRDREIADGVSIDFVSLDEPYPGEFYINVDYYDNDGLYLYTDNSRVVFFIAEVGEIKISLDAYHPYAPFPYDDAMFYITILLNDFMDPTVSTTDFCDIYGFIIDDCEDIRTQVFDNDGFVYLSNLYNEIDNVFYFEYGYQLVDGGVPIYAGIYLEFNYDESGQIIVTPHDNPVPNFTYANFVDAQGFWISYLQDYVNPEISTEELIDDYFGGFVDNTFYEVRTEDLLRGVSFDALDVSFEDPYNANGIDWITVTYVLTAGTVDNTLIENFRVMLFEDGYFQIEMESFYPEVVAYDVAYDLLNAYLNDLLNPEMDNDNFCLVYSEDWVLDCANKRDDLVTLFSSAELVDFYFNDYMFTYQATVDFFDADGLYLESRSYNIDYWFDTYGILKINIMDSYMDDFDPLYDELFDLMMNFPNEYLDFTVDSVDFCIEYFPAEPDCAVMRDDLLASASLYVSVDEFYSHPGSVDMGENDLVYEAIIVYSTGPDNFIRQQVEVVPVYDEVGILHIELYVIRTETSVPTGAVLLDETDALYYLNAFASDFSNPAVSYDDFCTLYFNGNTHCMDDRFEMIEMGGSVTYIGLTVETDNDGLAYLSVEFELDVNGDTQTAVANLRIWQIDPVNVFIEWVNVVSESVPPVG